MKKHLITQKDIKVLRKYLLDVQKNVDAITGFPLEEKDAVLDHDHKTQLVRGVLDRQINAFEGKIQNAYTRYIGWRHDIPLPRLLRAIAYYLEAERDYEYYHPKWINRCMTDFKKLNAKGQQFVLKAFFLNDGNNTKSRVSIFQSFIKNNVVTFDEIQDVISHALDYNNKEKLNK